MNSQQAGLSRFELMTSCSTHRSNIRGYPSKRRSAKHSETC
jgi:hypothetical protein